MGSVMIDMEMKLIADLKPMNPADILKSFKNPAAKMPEPTYDELMAKIAELEKEAAIAMAVETFLDCDYKKIKVSKRIARVPKYARGYVK